MPDVYDASSQKNDHKKEKEPVKKKARKEPSERSGVLRKAQAAYNPLSAFRVLPQGIRTEIQDEEEEILLVTRRHVITNLRWVLVALVMALVPLFFGMFPYFDLLPWRFQAMTALLWYLLTTAIILEGFFNWYFDVFVITDERIIDIDFKNLIYKNITSTKIENIEDVTFNVSGPLPSLLNYGNVLIQTAGAGVSLRPQETVPTIEMWNTPHPSEVARLINDLLLEEEQEKLEGRVR